MTRPSAAPLSPNESANFVSHRLVQEGRVWRYRPTPLARVLLNAISGTGYLCVAVALIALMSKPAVAMLVAAVGAAFSWLGRRISAQYAAGSAFDTARRRIDLLAVPLFGRRGHVRTDLDCIDFDQVQSLELLQKRVRDTSPDFVGFELNLVLRDGRRCNVVDHHDGELIAAEATILARLLGVTINDYRT